MKTFLGVGAADSQSAAGVCAYRRASTSRQMQQSASTRGLRSDDGAGPASGVVRPHRGARQLLRRGPRPRADAGRRQQERGPARGRPGRAPVPAQHASAGADRSGERFLRQVEGPLASLQAALSGARRIDEEPTGTLKVSMGQAFGRHFLVPLLDDFLARYPRVLPDWHFDNRRIDIVGEGFDAAVGGGFALASGVVARELARCTSSPWRRRTTWPAGRCRARPTTWRRRRHHAPLLADRTRPPMGLALAARGGAAGRSAGRG